MAGREDQLRLRILDEISQLRRGIGSVERHVDQTGAQARQIEQGAVDRLLRLDEDAVARRRAEPHQSRRIAAHGAIQLRIGQPDLIALNEKRRPFGKGRRLFEQFVEIAAQGTQEVLQRRAMPLLRG